MTDAPEFSRRFPLRRLGAVPVEEKVEADARECAHIARQLRLPAIASLACRFRLTAGEARAVLAEAWLAAKVTQVSVISGEPFADAIAETFTLRFVPREELREDEPLDLDAPDALPYDNDIVDLGAAVVEQLALALDPYPRMPGEGLEAAVDVAPPEGEGSGEDAGEAARPNPFAALAARRGEGH